MFSANRKGEGCKTTALSISEAAAPITEFCVEGAVFFQKLGDDLLLLSVDPTGDHGAEDLQKHDGSGG
jgi:hypothetical protein